MSMAEKKTVAGSDKQRPNETQEPKIYESGYFYLSHQINGLRDRMDAKFDRVDAKFEVFNREIKDLSNKTDARFDKVDARFDSIENKVDNFNKWAIGSVIAVPVGTISVIITLVLK